MKQHRGYYRRNKETGIWEEIGEPQKIETHAVITDEIAPMESYATPHREIFTSKSRYRKHLRALGFRETGGKHLEEKPEPESVRIKRHEEEVARDVERAYFDVKYDRVKFSEAQKEQHLREQRRLGKAWKIRAPY